MCKTTYWDGGGTHLHFHVFNLINECTDILYMDWDQSPHTLSPYHSWWHILCGNILREEWEFCSMWEMTGHTTSLFICLFILSLLWHCSVCEPVKAFMDYIILIYIHYIQYNLLHYLVLTTITITKWVSCRKTTPHKKLLLPTKSWK